MKLSLEQIEQLLQSDSKALATSGKHGLNVVPVSTIRVVDGKILLMNYFLHKTLENILENPQIALSCWKGLKGCQVKGIVEYMDTGEVFEEARQWVQDNVSNRTLKGLMVITPESIYDVSPSI